MGMRDSSVRPCEYTRATDDRGEADAMTASTRVDVPRSDVVGSLLRPAYLREARKGVREGKLSAAELRAVEDHAVREAIGLQESAGIDVITDGELRRNSWVVTI